MSVETSKMSHRNSFSEVLSNFDDQVIVRELLRQHVPAHIKEIITNEYNAHVDRYNSRLERLLKEEQEQKNLA